MRRYLAAVLLLCLAVSTRAMSQQPLTGLLSGGVMRPDASGDFYCGAIELYPMSAMSASCEAQDSWAHGYTSMAVDPVARTFSTWTNYTGDGNSASGGAPLMRGLANAGAYRLLTMVGTPATGSYARLRFSASLGITHGLAAVFEQAATTSTLALNARGSWQVITEQASTNGPDVTYVLGAITTEVGYDFLVGLDGDGSPYPYFYSLASSFDSDRYGLDMIASGEAVLL